MPASTWSTTDKSANFTLSGSNLIATMSAGSVCTGRGKDPKRTGKYYIEYTSTTTQSNNNTFGFAAAKTPLGVGGASSIGTQALGGGIAAYDSFGVQITGTGSIGGAITTGSLVCAAIDLDNQLVWFRLGAAGNWNNTASHNPATGVGGNSLAAVGLGQGIDVYPYALLGTVGNSVTANFGATAFTGAVPSGFTSGWDDSVTALSNMVATQIAAEEWATGTPTLQLTQAAIEQWAAVQTVTPQLALTQIALEQWASVAVIPDFVGGPMITMIGTP